MFTTNKVDDKQIKRYWGQRQVESKDIDNPSGLVPTLSNGQDNPPPSVSSCAKTKINRNGNLFKCHVSHRPDYSCWGSG